MERGKYGLLETCRVASTQSGKDKKIIDQGCWLSDQVSNLLPLERYSYVSRTVYCVELLLFTFRKFVGLCVWNEKNYEDHVSEYLLSRRRKDRQAHAFISIINNYELHNEHLKSAFTVGSSVLINVVTELSN